MKRSDRGEPDAGQWWLRVGAFVLAAVVVLTAHAKTSSGDRAEAIRYAHEHQLT